MWLEECLRAVVYWGGRYEQQSHDFLPPYISIIVIISHSKCSLLMGLTVKSISTSVTWLEGWKGYYEDPEIIMLAWVW